MADKDVLGKADALLRRHAIPLPGASGDAGDVPLLTDAIEPPVETAHPGAEPDLAQAIFDRVMEQVEGRLVAGVTELRQELANTIADAIKQELERRNVK